MRVLIKGKGHGMGQRVTPASKPLFEPEITLPGQVDWRSAQTLAQQRLLAEPSDRHRLYLANLWPLAIALLAPAIVVLSAAILIALLGIFVVWLWVLGVLFAATITPDLMRYIRRCASLPAGALAHRAFGFPGR